MNHISSRSKLKRRFALFLIAIILISAYITFCASRSLTAIGKAQFKSDMYEALYIGIGNITETYFFDDLFTYVTDDDGNIKMISTDGLKINLLTKKVADECYLVCQAYASKGISVPLGAFTGIAVLSGLGRKVRMQLVNITSVKCVFSSEFTSAGINQTRQCLYLNIVTDCVIFAGLCTDNIVGEVQVLCYENFIIGDIPEAYVNFEDYTKE